MYCIGRIRRAQITGQNSVLFEETNTLKEDLQFIFHLLYLFAVLFLSQILSPEGTFRPSGLELLYILRSYISLGCPFIEPSDSSLGLKCIFQNGIHWFEDSEKWGSTISLEVESITNQLHNLKIVISVSYWNALLQQPFCTTSFL